MFFKCLSISIILACYYRFSAFSLSDFSPGSFFWTPAYYSVIVVKSDLLDIPDKGIENWLDVSSAPDRFSNIPLSNPCFKLDYILGNGKIYASGLHCLILEFILSITRPSIEYTFWDPTVYLDIIDSPSGFRLYSSFSFKIASKLSSTYLRSSS